MLVISGCAREKPIETPVVVDGAKIVYEANKINPDDDKQIQLFQRLYTNKLVAFDGVISQVISWDKIQDRAYLISCDGEGKFNQVYVDEDIRYQHINFNKGMKVRVRGRISDITRLGLIVTKARLDRID